MYTPPAFRDDDLAACTRPYSRRAWPTDHRQRDGLMATPLPLFLDEAEGEHGVLYGHLAKANPQWKVPADRRRNGDLHGA